MASFAAQLLLTGPLMLGLITFFLAIAREERPTVNTAFSGFSNFGSAFTLHLLVSIFTLQWTLLLIVPGIIAGYRYSQAFYILRDNPEIGAMEAIRRSKTMMAEHKWRLFVLQLTFIGWHLLCMLSLCIGYLWLVPYIMAAGAHFYEDLKTRSEFTAPQGFVATNQV